VNDESLKAIVTGLGIPYRCDPAIADGSPLIDKAGLEALCSAVLTGKLSGGDRSAALRLLAEVHKRFPNKGENNE
jgi:hypothetical protein